MPWWWCSWCGWVCPWRSPRTRAAGSRCSSSCRRFPSRRHAAIPRRASEDRTAPQNRRLRPPLRRRPGPRLLPRPGLRRRHRARQPRRLRAWPPRREPRRRNRRARHVLPSPHRPSRPSRPLLFRPLRRLPRHRLRRRRCSHRPRDQRRRVPLLRCHPRRRCRLFLRRHPALPWRQSPGRAGGAVPRRTCEAPSAGAGQGEVAMAAGGSRGSPSPSTRRTRSTATTSIASGG
jgi:hypothetical protein